MNIQTISKFLESRSAISASAFCREAGFTKRYLDYILEGEKPLTENVIKKIKPIMKKYGYGAI